MYLEDDETLPTFSGPYRHLGRGIVVNAADAACLEAQTMAEESTSMEDLCLQIVAMIWPSTTALTYRTPCGIGAKHSGFHTGRIEIASRKYPLTNPQ